jgi:hypothetical protein
MIIVPSIKTALTDELAKLQKIESLGGCIAKIRILEVELKIAPNFWGGKMQFSLK